jgi:membrane protease YdiL (CAAX protease family)
MTASIFVFALVYAVLISPFIGGVRGLAPNLCWLAWPLIFLWRDRKPAWLGLRLPASLWNTGKIAGLSAALGCGTGAILLLAAGWYPSLLQFIYALPGLHRGVCGDHIVLFIFLIPVAHFAHELFYRGFLQMKLAVLLKSVPAAIAVAAVLFAWTHVFVFSSPEIQSLEAQALPASAMQEMSVEAVLKTVTLFTLVESAGAGILLQMFGTLIAPVLFRTANLTTIVIVLYSRAGLV